MKIQDTYFTIKKISYPNCDNRNGIFRVEVQQGHPVYIIQMIKECAQIMAHDHFILSRIKKYTHAQSFIPQPGKLYIIRIFLSQKFKEGTGNIHNIEAYIQDYKSTTETKYVTLSGELVQIK